MWFLIKGGFWFAAVLVVLSYFSSRPAPETEAVSGLQVTDTLRVATEAYQYMSGLCAEKPEVCEKGAETLMLLGHRAREGARVAFEILDSQFTEDGKAPLAADEPLAELADPDPTPFPGKGGADTIMTGAIPLPQPKPLH
ncbi:DUF5330 domain-containing protein [Rhizobium sp. LCM 4573]|uniref:DUF5330 domain-containing protein n=1 Tax=Rhizobium sp. LCM 4573 TaxID=1848291 RepID=UPI0008DA9396|nr:DUF5330 domain-containing protein [Rhizobium sp. LCM 4573]OHV75614.1 hypothetical protein LCM4573_15835 [Rhizobium sp. LCM 4573]